MYVPGRWFLLEIAADNFTARHQRSRGLRKWVRWGSGTTFAYVFVTRRIVFETSIMSSFGHFTIQWIWGPLLLDLRKCGCVSMPYSWYSAINELRTGVDIMRNIFLLPEHCPSIRYSFRRFYEFHLHFCRRLSRIWQCSSLRSLRYFLFPSFLPTCCTCRRSFKGRTCLRVLLHMMPRALSNYLLIRLVRFQKLLGCGVGVLCVWCALICETPGVAVPHWGVGELAGEPNGSIDGAGIFDRYFLRWWYRGF